MKDHKWNFKRFTAIALAAALVFEGAAPVYAFPGETEDLSLKGNEAEIISEGSVYDIDVDLAEAADNVEEEDALSEDAEIETDAEGLSSEEDAATAGEISPEEPEAIAADMDGEVTVEHGTGYIAPEWEKDLPAIDPSLTPEEAQNMIEENKAGDFEGEPAEGYVEIPDADTINLPATYPASYSSTSALTAALNELPSTRNQLDYGSCWAHSAIALSELYKESRDSAPLAAYDDVDYSERHLSYYTFHNGTNPFSVQPGDDFRYEDASGNLLNEKATLGEGGNLDDAAATLRRWRGVADDTLAPYPEDYGSRTNPVSVNWLGDNIETNDEVHLTDAYFINISTSNGMKHAKNWIVEHGGIGISFNTKGSGIAGDDGGKFYNEDYNSFYNYETPNKTNHAVTVVGWDDSFPRENFTDGTNIPSEDGAWLVRNSWGRPSDGDNIFSYFRYFWLSYKDVSLSPTAYAYVVKDASEDAYKHNYYYDSQTANYGWYGSWSWNNGAITRPSLAANVFTVQQSQAQNLTDVSFYVGANNFESTTATISIYRLNDGFTSPVDGMKVAGFDVNIPYPGRYTVPVPTSEIPGFEPGETFSVITELAYGNSVGFESGSTVNYKVNGVLASKRIANVGMKANESYLGNYRYSSGTATEWQDLNFDSNHINKGYGNFLISAITEDVSSGPVEADPEVSFGTTEVTKTFGDDPFKVEATRKGNGTITYSSSVPSVAVVNKDSGLVTIKSAGETVIKADVAADTVNNYKAGSATYKLIVNEKAGATPVKLKSGSSVSFKSNELTVGQALSVLEFNDGAKFVTDDTDETEVSGTLAWKDETEKPAFGTTSATWKFTPDSADYAPLEGTVTIKVNKIDMSDAVVTLGPALTYNGEEQEQTVVAVTLNGTALTDNDYEVTGNKQTEAGNYTLTVSAAETGDYTGSVTKDFSIGRAEHDDCTVSETLKWGESGTVDLSEFIEEGGKIGALSVSDENGILDEAPAIAGNILSYKFKDDIAINGKSATVTIPVTDAKNYEDYTVTVTLNVAECAHEHKKIDEDTIKAATCVDHGYTGDIICADCGAKISDGEYTDKDPDNHDYDAGVKTREETLLIEGVITYTCKRAGCNHKMTKTVPCLTNDTGEDLDDLIKDLNAGDGEDDKTDANVVINPDPDDENKKEIIITVGDGEDETEVSKIIKEGDEVVSEETRVWVGGLHSTYRYTGSAIKPQIYAYDGTRKLAAGKDYSVSFKNNKKAGSTAKVTVNFKGNYKKLKKTYTFRIVPAILSQDPNESDVNASEICLYANGKQQKPVPSVIWKAGGKSVSKKDLKISYIKGDGSDEPVKGVKAPGIYYARITPKNGSFTGEQRVKITVKESKNLVLSSATVSMTPNTFPYTGSEIVPAEGSYKLTLAGEELTKGEDYVLEDIKNNINPGKATMVFAAIPGNVKGISGKKTYTFKITKGIALDRNNTNFVFDYKATVPYAKGGAKPALKISYCSEKNVLKAGKDYTIKYSRNTADTGEKETAVITVKGKGKFKGKVILNFAIEKQDIENLADRIVIADKAVSRKGYKNPKVTITDLNGKKLKQGKDFKLEYDPDLVVEPGDIVDVTVKGLGNYTNSTTVSYRYIASKQLISKLGAEKLPNKTYTGRPILLTYDELCKVLYVKNGKTKEYLTPEDEFKVEGYSKNIKKGTASVTLKGINSYGGTKTLKFKITQKAGDYAGAMIDGEWK